MIDPNMQRYFQRIYGAKPSPEILRSRPERKPPKRRTVFVNRLYEDSTKSPSLIFEDTFKREYARRSQGERRGSSLPESSRSSGLSRKIDDFLNSVVIQEKEKNEHLRGSTRSLSSSARTKRSVSSSCSSRRRRRMDYPLPDLSKVKSTLLGSKHYQGPKGRSQRSSSSDRYPPPRIHAHPHHHNTLSTDNDSSQDSAYAGESSRQHTPVGRNHRFRRRPSMNLHHDDRGSQFELSTYLKYLNEVTTDILAQGAYSPKSLNQILESRFLQYEKETSRREALDMMAKLKKDLGISSNFTPQKEPSRSREHLSSAGGSRRKRKPVRSSNNFLGENTNLYRSRSCDDVLDIYSDKELFNLLKKDAGLDKKLADDVIRVVRGRSEENLCRSSYSRTKKKEASPKDKTHTPPRNGSGQQEDGEEEEEDLYNDEEFEKSESSEEEVKEEVVVDSSEDE